MSLSDNSLLFSSVDVSNVVRFVIVVGDSSKSGCLKEIQGEASSEHKSEERGENLAPDSQCVPVVVEMLILIADHELGLDVVVPPEI